jgi:hypothetical protein
MMAALTVPTLQTRPKSVHRMRPLWQAVPGAEPSLVGSDQFTDERRRRLKKQQQHLAPALVNAASNPAGDPLLTPVNRRLYLAVWPGAAFVGWAVFVPDWMSRTTFGWLNGAVLASLAGLTLWRGTRPTRSGAQRFAKSHGALRRTMFDG